MYEERGAAWMHEERVVTYEALGLDASAEAERARHIKDPQRLHLLSSSFTQSYMPQ
jgi:hypothetical protein